MADAIIPAGWSLGELGLVKNLEFKNFIQALAFVVEAGRAAEEADHHPDMTISWNKVELRLISHSEGKVTAKDYEMAARLNAISTPQILARTETLFV